MTTRHRISIFDLENDLYSGASVSFYTVDVNGDKTSTLVTLYDASSGSGTLSNPQTLNGSGRLAQEVWVEEATVATISGLSVADHDTGIMYLPGLFRDTWATSTVYRAGDIAIDGSNGGNTLNLYACNTTHTSGTWATDKDTNGYWDEYVTIGDISSSAAASIGVLEYTFDDSTTMADPGSGDVRLNNATPASATAASFSNTTSGSGTPDVSDFIAAFDDATNATGGAIITFRLYGTPGTFASYYVTAVTDNTSWLQLSLTYIAGSGTFSASDTVMVQAAFSGQDGASTMSELSDDLSPQLGASLDTNSFGVKWSKGGDIASGSALTLGSDGNAFDVTGTTNITSITTVKVGMLALLQFDGVLTLTHHATNLISFTGANITTAAGGQAIVHEYDTGKWRIVAYSPYPTATTTVSGVVEKSTSAENVAGVATDVYPDVAGVKEMIDTYSSGVGDLIHEEWFTSSGTWTKPSGTTSVFVVAVGGGGGGKGMSTWGTDGGDTTFGSHLTAGGGGGGGGVGGTATTPAGAGRGYDGDDHTGYVGGDSRYGDGALTGSTTGKLYGGGGSGGTYGFTGPGGGGGATVEAHITSGLGATETVTVGAGGTGGTGTTVGGDGADGLVIVWSYK